MELEWESSKHEKHCLPLFANVLTISILWKIIPRFHVQYYFPVFQKSEKGHNFKKYEFVSNKRQVFWKLKIVKINPVLKEKKTPQFLMSYVKKTPQQRSRNRYFEPLIFDVFDTHIES